MRTWWTYFSLISIAEVCIWLQECRSDPCLAFLNCESKVRMLSLKSEFETHILLPKHDPKICVWLVKRGSKIRIWSQKCTWWASSISCMKCEWIHLHPGPSSCRGLPLWFLASILKLEFRVVVQWQIFFYGSSENTSLASSKIPLHSACERDLLFIIIS